jgi:tetratricopeptide (TPR) repeat protein
MATNSTNECVPTVGSVARCWRSTGQRSIHNSIIWAVSVVLLSCASLWAQNTRPATRPDVVARFIGAVQHQDFKTLIDLTYNYHGEIAQIKARNPQVLWPRLLDEYYKQRISTLASDPGLWINYAGAITGDPAESIRALLGLLPLSCKWTTTETRSQKARNMFGGPTYTQTTVFVKVNFPSLETAPIVENKLLKQTILQFNVHAETHTVISAARLPIADAYWTGGPDVRMTMAKRFFGANLWDTAISELEPLASDNKLPSDGRLLLGSAHFQHVTQGCFANMGQYLQLNQGDECVEHINRALTLNSSLRKDWVSYLLSDVNLSVAAGNAENAASLVNTAARYTAGDAALEKLAVGSRESVGRLYMARADEYLKAQGFNGAVNWLKSAIEFWPDESRKRALAMARVQLNQYFESTGAFFTPSFDSAFGLLDSMKTLGLRIPAPDVTEFLQYGKQIPQRLPYVTGLERSDARSEWERRVKELAAGEQELTTVPPSASSVRTSVAAAPAAAVAPSTLCDSSSACSAEGIRYFDAKEWSQSLPYFDRAVSLQPTWAYGWQMAGKAHLALGHLDLAAEQFTKAVQLGSIVTFDVCHERAFWCDRDKFMMSASEITLTDPKGKKVFGTPPTAVVILEVAKWKANSAYIRLEVANKKYNLYPVPFIGQCTERGIALDCPGQADLMIAMGKVIEQVIGALNRP